MKLWSSFSFPKAIHAYEVDQTGERIVWTGTSRGGWSRLSKLLPEEEKPSRLLRQLFHKCQPPWRYGEGTGVVWFGGIGKVWLGNNNDKHLVSCCCCWQYSSNSMPDAVLHRLNLSRLNLSHSTWDRYNVTGCTRPDAEEVPGWALDRPGWTPDGPRVNTGCPQKGWTLDAGGIDNIWINQSLDVPGWGVPGWAPDAEGVPGWTRVNTGRRGDLFSSIHNIGLIVPGWAPGWTLDGSIQT